MQLPWVAVGALGAAISVVAGAFGAHGLKTRLDPTALAQWETAARYLMYGSLGLILLGLMERGAGRSIPVNVAGWPLLVGTLIFSLTVSSLALGGPRWMGAVTPIGGGLMILGFVLFAWSALRL